LKSIYKKVYLAYLEYMTSLHIITKNTENLILVVYSSTENFRDIKFKKKKE